MKRLTKSQYEEIAGVLRPYVTERIEEAQDPDPKVYRRADNELSLIRSIANELADKWTWTDDEFRRTQFMQDCGF